MIFFDSCNIEAESWLGNSKNALADFERIFFAAEQSSENHGGRLFFFRYELVNCICVFVTAAFTITRKLE